MSTDVTLTGRLTRDPDLKFSQAGKAVTRFAVVTSRRVKDQKTGEWSDADTTFWDCVAFGELANNVAESPIGAVCSAQPRSQVSSSRRWPF